MIANPRFLSRPLSLLVLSLCVGGTLSGPLPPALGQVEPTFRVTFEPPTDDRLDDSAGGASRPVDRQCHADESTPVPMAALMPENIGVGLTLASHPTVLAYVPPTSARRALFSLKDETGNIVYQNTLTLTQSDGIATIALPADAPPLSMEQTYEWSLGILCEPIQTDFPIAIGRIRRIPQPFELGDRMTSLERAALYGQSGLWYDTLAILDRMRRSQPENEAIAIVWTDFLDSVGLEDIASKPPLNLE